MKYTRRIPEVEALVFSPELATLTDDGKKLTINAGAKKLGISYVEGKGYRFRDAQVRFGDFMVLTAGVKPVWSPEDFTAQFRPAKEETT